MRKFVQLIESREIKFSIRLLRRDARAGELRLLAAAIVIAIAALTAVGFFADRVRMALEREAHQLLGADLLLTADQPWPASVSEAARARGLQVTTTAMFPSMVLHGGASQLTEIKAVSPGYPLRGRLRTAPALNAPDGEVTRTPGRGEIWADERLASALSLKVGDTLTVGQTRLQMAGVLTQEPDRGVNFFSVAPRLMMHEDDLADTRLILRFQAQPDGALLIHELCGDLGLLALRHADQVLP